MNVSPTPDTVMPEFYDRETAVEKYLPSKPTKPNRRRSDLTLPALLTQWHERGKAEVDRLRKLLEMAVMVHRRYRAVTISDAFGYWGTLPETQGRWIEYDPEEDGEVHPINIVRPDIRANVASLMQIKLGVRVAAVNKDAKRAENAARLEAMIGYFERTTWTRGDRNLMFDGIHKEGSWLLENYKKPCGSQKTQVPEPGETHYASYKCKGCGTTGKTPLPNAPTDQAGAFSTVKCPVCGETAPAIPKSVQRYNLAEKEVPEYEICHRLWSLFNILPDRKNGRLSGIAGMQWLRIHEVISRAELESQYPQFKFDAPFEFCFPLKCQMALACNDWSMLNNVYSPLATSTVFDEFEVDTYCLHEDAYKNHVEPTGFVFRGADGQIKFEIKADETIGDAQKRLWGKNFRGLRFKFVNDQLIDILTPTDAELNFRETFSDIHFCRDSASFLSIPHWDSVQLNDDITNYNSIKSESAAANSRRPVWFNSAVFSPEDFSDYFIPSRDDFMDENFDVRKAVASIENARTSEELTEHLIFLLQSVRPLVSSVTPALRGEAQPNQPYAAQRQQLEQSYGILAPASVSYAELYLLSMKQKLAMAFECWTLEQFQKVASSFGEQWTEQIVGELVKTDLEKDVRFEIAEGTDQPQGQMAKELRFYNALGQLMPFIQGGIVPPEVLRLILKKIDEFGGFDFDLSGLETADALAQKRFEQMAVACKPHEAVSRQRLILMMQTVVAEMPAIDPATGQPAIDPATGQPLSTPITEFDQLLESLVAQSDIYVSPFEDVGAQQAFFKDRITEELAKTRPNNVLIAFLEYFLSNADAFLQQKAQQAVMDDPMRIAEQADQDRAAEAEAARAADEAARADADAQAAAEEKLADKAHEAAESEKAEAFEREKIGMEMLDRERQREHEVELAKTGENNDE